MAGPQRDPMTSGRTVSRSGPIRSPRRRIMEALRSPDRCSVAASSSGPTPTASRPGRGYLRGGGGRSRARGASGHGRAPHRRVEYTSHCDPRRRPGSWRTDLTRDFPGSIRLCSSCARSEGVATTGGAVGPGSRQEPGARARPTEVDIACEEEHRVCSRGQARCGRPWGPSPAGRAAAPPADVGRRRSVVIQEVATRGDSNVEC